MREGVSLFGRGTKLRGIYRVRIIDMKEKEPTLFEETSVTKYEHDHGYTFLF